MDIRKIIEVVPGGPDAVVLASLSGSRLYGVHRPGSDWDFLVVSRAVERPRHITRDGADIQVFSVPAFARVLSIGAANPLEARWSPHAVWGRTGWEPYIRALEPDRHAARMRLLADRKQRSSSPGKLAMSRARLSWMAIELCATGRFSPALDEDVAAALRVMRNGGWDAAARRLRDLALRTALGEDRRAEAQGILDEIRQMPRNRA